MNRSSNIAAIEPASDMIHLALREAELLRAMTAGDGSSGVGNAAASAGTLASVASSDTFSAFAASFPGYQLIREIHRGGQGIVFQAVRESTGDDVAIKVLHDGAAAKPRELERFEREAAVLRDLNHPNIIAISEIGIAASEGGAGSRPYLVMPYIPGWPLDEFVRRNGLSIRETLELFVKIGEAVNAAHLNGVIHRDLKPSNVPVDDAGEPHVLDFGLAKSMAAPPGQTLTETGQFVGSLPWASPEQAAGESSRIDIRTDVYSLGVILYQLLTGCFPYDVTGPMRDVLNRIVTAEPARPRAVGVASDPRVGRRRRGFVASSRTSRHSGGRSVASPIDDELETIVLKCLQKDPARRYQSAGELATDIRHYLAGEPIEAKRDSAWYMLGKTLRRHRAAVAVGAAILVALTAGAAVSTVYWFRAQRESIRAEGESKKAREHAARAEAVNKFLNDMLSALDPATAGTRDTTLMREILDKAAARIDAELADQPEAEAAVRSTIGRTFATLALYEEAEKHAKRALEIRLQILGKDHADTRDTLAILYAICHEQPTRRADAIPFAERIYASATRVFGKEHSETFKAMSGLGEAYRNVGRHAEAEPLLSQALDALRAEAGERDWKPFVVMNNLGLLYKDTGRGAAAEPLFVEAAAGVRRILGPDHPVTWTVTGVLASHYREQGRFSEAEPLLIAVTEAQQRALGPEHQNTLHWRARLAQLYLDSGRPQEAETVMREVVAVRRRTLGNDHPTTLMELTFLAFTLLAQGRHVEVEPLYLESLAGWRRLRGNTHRDTAQALTNLGRFYRDLKRFDEADPLLREALAVRRKLVGDAHPDVANALNDLATLFQDKGDYPAAEPFLREALEVYRHASPASGTECAGAMALLGSALLLQGKFAEAEPVLRECLEIRTAAFPDERPQSWLRFNTMSMLGESLTGQNKFSEAEPLLIESYEKMRPPPGPVTEGRKREALARLVKFYETRAEAEPNQGFAEKAADWRAKLGTIDSR